MESKSTDELEKILGSTHINEVSAYLKSNEESIITNEYAFHEYISKLIKLKNLRKQDVFLAADVPEKYVDATKTAYLDLYGEELV